MAGSDHVQKSHALNKAEDTTAPTQCEETIAPTQSNGTTTSPNNSKNPQKTVLETVELSENILLHLPAKDLYPLQRVSSLWKQILSTSPTLRDKLFLRLKSSQDTAWTLVSTGETNAFVYDEVALTIGLVHMRNLVELHPLLRHSGDYAKLDAKLLPSHTGPWRGAFVTDPACHEAHVQIDWHVEDAPPSRAMRNTFGRAGVKITSQSGLTFGDVIDAIGSQNCRYFFSPDNYLTRFKGHTLARLSTLITAMAPGTSSTIFRDVSQPMKLHFYGRCVPQPP